MTGCSRWRSRGRAATTRAAALCATAAAAVALGLLGAAPVPPAARAAAAPPSDTCPGGVGSITLMRVARTTTPGTEAGPDWGAEHTGGAMDVGGVPVAGVTFTVRRVADVSDAGAASLADLTAEELRALPAVGGVEHTATTDAAGSIVWEALTPGVYLVAEATLPGAEAPEPLLVPVPLPDPAGDGWICDVHVYPKGERVPGASPSPSAVPFPGTGWGPLPVTGADAARLLAVAAGLVLVGVVLRVARRRRAAGAAGAAR